MKANGGSLFKTDAITLRSYSYGENDKIVTLFSDELGMVQAIAKGARKIKSHMLSATLPFCEGSYLLYKGRSLYTITQYEFKRAYKNISDDMSNLLCAEFMAELTLKTGSEYFDRRLYYLLRKGLRCLDEGCLRPELLDWAFALYIMDINGVFPNLDRCTHCGEVIEGTVWFSAAAGGVVCSACHSRHADSFMVGRATLSALKYIKTHRFEDLSRISLSKKSESDINNIVRNCLSYYISPDIKTANLLNLHVIKESRSNDGKD
jgi:DNA repair protein RecO (recombination protein O)